MHDILYLGSQSPARQQLLRFAQIPFEVISHRSSEQLDGYEMDFKAHVQAIAHDKMQSLLLPSYDPNGLDRLFVLTADTLIQVIATQEILEKPTDKDDAIRMLKLLQKGPIEVVTGVCLKHFHWRHDVGWQEHANRIWVSSAFAEFDVDDQSLERYFALLPMALNCSGASIAEEHGLSYLKSINGSYSAVLGLPLYELRNHLLDLGFIFPNLVLAEQI